MIRRTIVLGFMLLNVWMGAQGVDVQINEESQKSTGKDAHVWRMEEWRS